MSLETEGHPAQRTGSALPIGYRLHWYEVQQVAGQGGFGVTYACRDSNLDAVVAVKEFFPLGFAVRDNDAAVRPANRQVEKMYRWGLKRFIDEARTLAKFRHLSIVRVSSVFEANGTAYMVMDFEHGISLAESIKQGTISNESQLLPILSPLLHGLEQIHEAGFIHRDIKPNNILIRENETPVLVDFGSARQAVASDERQLTAVVSRGYAPFEQYDAGSEIRQGPWSDVYSLGATLYEVVTGQRPAAALTRGSALLEGRLDPLQPLDNYSGSDRFSVEIKNAIAHALAFAASDRPKCVADWCAWYPVLDSQRPNRQMPDAAHRAPIGTSTVFVNEGNSNGSAMRDAVTAQGDVCPSGTGVRDLRTLHVLVVDDEPFIVNMTRRILDRLGVGRVTTAGTGTEALARIVDDANPPHVVICDLNMPEMDGFELFRHLGQRRIDSGVILVTGEDERVLRAAETLARAHELNVLAALLKSSFPDSLEDALRAMDIPRAARTRTRVEPVTEAELDEALRRGGVTPVYQPLVSLKTRDVISVEALARLNHPTRGLLDPDAFLPLADNCERMDALTDMVMAQAVAQVGEWRAMGVNLKLSVNVSVDSLSNFDFAGRILGAVEAEGLHPSQLTLEVTETRLNLDPRTSLETLLRLRIRGVALSIDDFGSGYSTLEQIKRAPFTELKIDQAFVSGVGQDAYARAILESSVALAKRLNLNVIAEGVETSTDWDLVKDLGCNLAQGFFIARPMPGDQIPRWIEQWQSA